ncbi:MAG: hypothetical protein HC888_09570 [Candidatus Competibacteraceae bacterium]|nr:hypothetical protein [Candidatus Competibacteraceae bacterium]
MESFVERYAKRVGYSEQESAEFQKEGHRVRQVNHLSRVASKYSIEAKIVSSKNCNSGHVVDQTMVLDVDGNLISKFCPSRMCVYLVSQLTIPIALINERFSEGLEPNDFHFMRIVQCPDAGVECLGYGKVKMEVKVIPRVKSSNDPNPESQ